MPILQQPIIAQLAKRAHVYRLHVATGAFYLFLCKQRYLRCTAPGTTTLLATLALFNVLGFSAIMETYSLQKVLNGLSVVPIVSTVLALGCALMVEFVTLAATMRFVVVCR